MMTDEYERFEEFRAVSEAENVATVNLFVERNDLNQLIRDGFLIEYEQEHDHLYITFGERRDGMALIGAWPLVFIADPETLECLGIEIVDFRVAVEAGLAKGWAEILPLVMAQPVLRDAAGSGHRA